MTYEQLQQILYDRFFGKGIIREIFIDFIKIANNGYINYWYFNLYWRKFGSTKFLQIYSSDDFNYIDNTFQFKINEKLIIIDFENIICHVSSNELAPEEKIIKIRILPTSSTALVIFSIPFINTMSIEQCVPTDYESYKLLKL